MPAYYIGEIFGGGKIVYIDKTKVHGLIASSTDLAYYYRWDNNSYAEWTYAWSWDDGANNTDLIISAEGNYGNAASACRNYYGGGYSDWFLPAFNQLHNLFEAKDKIAVIPSYYWSSTENSSDISAALTVRMDSQNGEEWGWTKSYLYAVRPYRAF